MIIGIGTDLIDCRRIEKAYLRLGERFIDRICTVREKEWAALRQQNFKRWIATIAKLFAAKEATLKALGTGLTQGITWHDIEISRTPKGQPFIKLKNEAEKVCKNLLPDNKKFLFNISLTDEWPYAQAFVTLTAE